MSTRHQTACPLDCPDACTLDVEVADDRVLRVRGDHRNPLTAGFICAKVARVGQHLSSPERVRHPLRRVGPKGSGQFEQISWDAALDLVVEAFQTAIRSHGPESILPCSYGGSNGFVTEGSFDARLFGRLGATRLDRTLCAAPTGAAQRGLYGRMVGGSLQDVLHSKLIVIWGCNPSATSIHFLRQVRAARKAGAKLVVVDPVTTPLAREADLHVALRPGTDVVLALAMIRALFATGREDAGFLAAHTRRVERLRASAERWTLPAASAECGLPASTIDAFVDLYASSAPAMIRCGWGPERNRNGGNATAAILALPAVAGKFGVRGGGYIMSNSGAWAFDAGLAADAPESAARRVNLSQLGPALTELDDPPVRVVYVYNCNPASTVPDQEAVIRGLMRDDLFVVVHDAVMTDTALLADLVLPATHFLEHRDLARAYGALVLNPMHPVVPPPGEARPNAAVFVALCDRLGLSKPGDARTPQELIRRILAQAPDAERLARELDQGNVAGARCGPRPVAFVDSFPGTPDGKIDLFPQDLDDEAPLGLYGYQPDPGTPAYPLALVSPAIPGQISSTFGQLRTRPGVLAMHPDDAAARGLAQGQSIKVFNERGEVRCALDITPVVRPGVVRLPKGLWARHTTNGRTANALIPPTTSDLAGGACYNDARVQVVADSMG